MGDFTESTTVDADADALFDYLSDVHNLPKYFSSMTSAEPGDGEEVHTTAEVDGNEVAGDAWFRVDQDRQRIEWGSEGPNDYNGYLDVTPSGDGSQVEVHIHTTRVPDGNSQVTEGLQETLSNIKHQVEQARATAG